MKSTHLIARRLAIKPDLSHGQHDNLHRVNQIPIYRHLVGDEFFAEEPSWCIIFIRFMIIDLPNSPEPGEGSECKRLCASRANRCSQPNTCR